MANTKRAELTVVGPDLEALNRVLTEAQAETQPAVSVSATVRNFLVVEMRELEKEREVIVDRRRLLTTQVEATLASLDAQLADHDEALAMYRAALGGEPT